MGSEWWALDAGCWTSGGRFQGNWVFIGNTFGWWSRFQSCWRVSGNLSWCKKWWGGDPSPFQRLKASANTLSWPGMWVTSTSRLELEISKLSFSKNKAMGMLVENNLLATASAVELSDYVGIRMGILAPGKNRLAIYTSAIWAKVSKLEMSFCKSWWTGILSCWNSETWSWRLNHEHWPDGKLIRPPMPHDWPAA